ADPIAASGGNPARLYAIERDIALLETRTQQIEIAGQRAALTQAALAQVQQAGNGIGTNLIGAVGRGDTASAERIASSARSGFEQAVEALNTRFGSRTLFSGAEVEGAALASSDEILTDILALANGAATGGAALAAVRDYFAPGGGFEATGYLGSTNDAPSTELSPGVRVDYAIRADDENLRAMLEGLAIGVVAAEGTLTGDDQLFLFRETGERVIAATDRVVDVRATLGVAEERIETANIRTSAERTFLNEARNAIISRDPFEAAAELTGIETQLATLFSVTARLSQLNLSSFLR
ncbi:MAG: flagellin, partial [Pseudomonadota bacterium]